MPNVRSSNLHKIDESTYSYIYEENVTIPLKSNSGVVRCNVYRPKNGPKSPVLITYGPYGKDIPYKDFLKHSFDEINPKHKSEHSGFEVPDPAFWTNEGYAIVRADEVGIGQSPGVVDTMSKSTADAFFEVIEWAAEQQWSTGKVALLGISYFAGTQWRVASRRPKGLSCILPYEGMADYYRDRSRHAGILTNKFLHFWYNRQIRPNQYGLAGKAARNWGPDTIEGDLSEDELTSNRREQPADNAANAFRDDLYYASKEYNLEDIEVPLLSVGNWGNINCHLRGNVLGFMYAGSKLKFLRMVTGRHDLPFYSDEEVEHQKSFLSAFLKDNDYAGWTTGKQPQVSLVLRHSGVEINNPEAAKAFEQRTENEWPLARTGYEKFYLTPDNVLSTVAPEVATSRLTYPALSTMENPQTLTFTTAAFERRTEVTGHIVASLNISATAHLGPNIPQDIDVFLTLRHIGVSGEEVFYTGTIGDPVPLCKGWLRASLRKTNTEHARHESYLPYRDYFSTDVSPVIPGEVYAVDVEMWPTCVVLQQGEKLLFEISSGDTQGAGIFVHDGEERSEQRFGGLNHIHFGPSRLNYVTLPVIPNSD